MLLAVDTSTQSMGAALYHEEEILGEFTWKTRRHHTTELAPSVAELLERCGVAMGQMECLAIALGPGSFTSLRIGLAYVKGLALALHIPVVGIPTLDILAASISADERPLVALLQAGRGRIAYQVFHHGKKGWQSEHPASLGRSAELAGVLPVNAIICGEMTGDDRSVIKENLPNCELCSPADSLRRSGYLAQMAWKRYRRDDVDDPATIAPIYLHVGTPIPG
ncbi:MAG: tRNA (adenosine(37)-N6)-threonylcarbamoyltransferase complex dimerization subunit type 1 TsaB [Anaerolineae bacterium]|nr:tRNA (adenosine(37)-N6)-threonylcarbamoyltransferase complex dimerization subunit type 1 TsaB [Anaerolineae bacterium]